MSGGPEERGGHDLAVLLDRSITEDDGDTFEEYMKKKMDLVQQGANWWEGDEGDIFERVVEGGRGNCMTAAVVMI